jgi:IgA-specific serine endopeptidase
VNGIRAFLGVAERRVKRRLAFAWGLRGAVVAAVIALACEVAARRHPFEWRWAVLAAAVLGAAVAEAGWLRGRPSLAEVARIADRRLDSSERLSTALELAGVDGLLVSRQRADTEAWAQRADPRRVVARVLPGREFAAATAAVLVAVGLAMVPNPAEARHQKQQAAEAARNTVADDIGDLAGQAQSGAQQGEDPARRAALVGELRQAEKAVRDADSTETAVAALSHAQQRLASLGDSSPSGRQGAAAAAGAQLSSAAAGAPAGAALAATGGGTGDELRAVADAIPALSAGDRASLAAQLGEAAASAADPVQAEKLKQAADALAAGRTDEASAALTEAIHDQDQAAAARAAAALAALADSLPTLTPEQQAALAAALARAAASAAADPPLADDLSKAAGALRDARTADASDALKAAGRRTGELAAESELDSDISKVQNALALAKSDLLTECAGVRFSAQSADEPAVPSPASGPADCNSLKNSPKDEGAARQESKAKGGGDTGASSEKAGGQEGDGGGSGDGPGSKQSTDGNVATPGNSGAQPGGNANPQGFGEGPGRPNEQVYVPGVSGAGRSLALPGGTGAGGDTALVPYETVYGEYRASALSQADRQVIPERQRELLLKYFQATPP